MIDNQNESEQKKSTQSTPGSILNKIKFFEAKNTATQPSRPIPSRYSVNQPKPIAQEPVCSAKLEEKSEPKVEEVVKEEKEPKAEAKIEPKIEVSLKQTSIESANANEQVNNQAEEDNQPQQEQPDQEEQDNNFIPISNAYLEELNKNTQQQPESQPQISNEPITVVSTSKTIEEAPKGIEAEVKPEVVKSKPSSVLDRIKSLDSRVKPPANKEKKLKPPSSSQRFTSTVPETKCEPQPHVEPEKLIETALQPSTEPISHTNSTIPQDLEENRINEPQPIEKLLDNKPIPEPKQDNSNPPETKVKAMNKLFGDIKISPQELNRVSTITSTSKPIALEPLSSKDKKQETPLIPQPPQAEEVVVTNKARNILQSAKTMAFTSTKSPLSELDESTISSISSKQINPINEEVFLQPVEIPIEYANESFCEGFFIATIPKDKGKVVENSEGFIASCSHLICSDLPGMQPEIVYRYPEKDTKTLELNNLAASICFPTGIKICYEQSDPIAVKNYSSPITNQQGDRYYMMTYHFFYKMLNCEFIKAYTVYPLKSQMMKFCSDFSDKIEIDKKTRKKIDEQLEQCQELNFRDIVYVPFCICLISKYPYLREMEHALESLRIQLSNYRSTSEEIVKLVSYLINCIPIPPVCSKLVFGLPHSNQLHEIACPRYMEMTFLNKNLNVLLNVLSIENIVLIFRLMIFEQKILFVDSEYNRLSEVTEGFTSLIYPFQWIHTYIAIMSDQMMKYLQAFLPFLNGIHEDLFKCAKQVLNEAEEGVYIVYISKDLIDINSNINGKKIKIKNKINENVPALPKDIEAKLVKELKRIKAKLEKKLQSDREIDIMIQNCFISVFVELLFDFGTYLTVIDDYPLFNTNSLLEARPAEDAKFYQEFTETQLFQQFIQTFSNNSDTVYFNTMIQKYNSGKKLYTYETNDLKTVYETYDRIDTFYIIKPYFLQLERPNENDREAISQQLLKYYPKNEAQLHPYGIMKENYRIIGSIKEVKPEDKVLKYNYYQIPGTEIKTQAVSAQKEKSSSNIIAMRANIFESRQLINKIPNRSCKYVNGKRPEVDFSEAEKDEIREAIKDILSRIFKSEEVDQNKDKKVLLNNIDSVFGRNYFITSIYQNKTAGGTAKIINDSSFNLLSEVIFNALLDILKLEESAKNLESAILLIKSAMLYCKLNKKQQVSIFDNLYGRLHDYSLLLKEAFWEKWFDIEVTEAETLKKGKEKKAEVDDKKTGKTIEAIVRILLKFEIDKTFVFKIMTNMATSKIQKDSVLNSVKKSAENIIINARYR